MNLERVVVTNYRTFGNRHDFEISTGVNSFVGPNNCGKSNLFNAISLAMDPSISWSRDEDLPSFMLGGRPPIPRIELRFKSQMKSSHERTLMRRAEAYEQKVSGTTHTYASNGELRLAVTFAGGTAQRNFIARGAGSRTLGGDDIAFRELDMQFRKVVRFVFVKSGESLESLLAGRFREILQLVMNDHLGKEVQEAEVARLKYQDALQTGLLTHLKSQIALSVHDLFPEIEAADLIPVIPSVGNTLANVNVKLRDAATTGMLGKGTGVRGAVLVAMMKYLADQTKRSMIFAIEEPEAFLHPSAQEEMCKGLEALAMRDDVTLLLTTHSPYILSRTPESRVTAIRKDDKGCSSIKGVLQGNEDKVRLLSGLFRDDEMATLVDRSLSIPANATAVLVTEGYTDSEYVRVATALLGETKFANTVHLVPSSGTSQIVLQSILLRSATSIPVIVLLDSDDNGRSARDQLKKFGWSTGKNIQMLPSFDPKCHHAIEAEDLWPTSLIERAIKEVGGDKVFGSMERCGEEKHYRIENDFKSEVTDWICRNARTSHCAKWQEVVNQVAEKIKNSTKERGARETDPEATS